MKKSFAHLLVGLAIAVLAGSWTFTWNIATDRKQVIEAINYHVKDAYIHDKGLNHLTEKDLILYLEPMKQQLDRIEGDLKDIKNKK